MYLSLSIYIYMYTIILLLITITTNITILDISYIHIQKHTVTALQGGGTVGYSSIV